MRPGIDATAPKNLPCDLPGHPNDCGVDHGGIDATTPHYTRAFYYSYDPGFGRVDSEAILCSDCFATLKRETYLHISGFGTLPADPYCHWCVNSDPTGML